MATVFRCDRCHEDFFSKDRIGKMQYEKPDSDFIVYRDLCPKCIKGLEEYLQEIPKLDRG